MANIVITNPLILDTAGASKILTSLMVIQAIKWEPGNGLVAGDTCLLKDQNSNIIFEATADSATVPGSGLSLTYPLGFRVDGLILTTLSRGKVYVYLGGAIRPKV